MIAIDYTDRVNLLPSSIYDKESGSNLYKLFQLFVAELNEVENNIPFWYDRALSGKFLDKIGILKGVQRNGLDDEGYREELDIIRSLDIITIPAIYEGLKHFGTWYRVQELYNAIDYTYRTLNGEKFLDGTWLLSPDPIPVIKRYLDGTWLLNGTQVLEPYGVESLSILIELTTNSSYQYSRVFSEIQSLLAGITIYWEITIQIGASDTPPVVTNTEFIKYIIEVV